MGRVLGGGAIEVMLVPWVMVAVSVSRTVWVAWVMEADLLSGVMGMDWVATVMLLAGETEVGDMEMVSVAGLVEAV